MHQWIVTHADTLRLACFLSLFLLFAVLETYFERRRPHVKKTQRWPANLSIVVLNSLVLKLAFPLLAIDAAYVAQQYQWGLWHQLTFLPLWWVVIVTILLMDMAIYFQHRLFHRVPLLWRLHRVHHTDVDLDVTSGARFHPLEILLSMLIKIGLVFLLGAPIIAVILFEIALNGAAMFNHANIRISSKLERLLRPVVVTPDMHRIHHSILGYETHKNFGFFLSCWDRWFHSYVAQPEQGHQDIVLGQQDCRRKKDMKLAALLLQPFKYRN
ncbi:sterol desaturase family protein [Thaumasiovibrio subtropicus]|uniref:sterol desaturase family protein n=1 Tax=Thaumasiovibrio subtropicus TaxID=1891207 RepID=UPI000B35588E|nr:sterol desaturase family protein [Thaumasiovibrio subtropicus]